MELIRKSDAMHAVLHNQGDAAVAAVQNIKPVMKMKVKDGCMEGTKLSQIFIDEWAYAEMMGKEQNVDKAD